MIAPLVQVLCLVATVSFVSSARFDHFGTHRSGFQQHRHNPHHTFSSHVPPPPPPVHHRRPFIPILRYNQYGPINGVYSFDFETGNGIRRDERGDPHGPNGAVVSQGSWSFTFPDGTPADFTFVADENGYRPQSSLIPVGPPLPAHAIEQIRKAERERAQGIFHDGQYDHHRYQG